MSSARWAFGQQTGHMLHCSAAPGRAAPTRAGPVAASGSALDDGLRSVALVGCSAAVAAASR
eukprot:4027639-Lingulodinium_polyedra.AAC.1